MGKRDPRKIFEILFWLETTKNDHLRGGDEVASALVLRSVCLLLPKMPFYSQNCLFIF